MATSQTTRPGLAIVSFPQGIVEIALRITSFVSASVYCCIQIVSFAEKCAVVDFKTRASTSPRLTRMASTLNPHCLSPTQVLAVLALITVCVAVGTINNIDKSYRSIINSHEDRPDDVPETPDLVDNSRGVSGWIIFMRVAIFFYQPLVILLRLLNIGLINFRINIFLVIVRQLHVLS